jgi:hypothetical protein
MRSRRETSPKAQTKPTGVVTQTVRMTSPASVANLGSAATHLPRFGNEDAGGLCLRVLRYFSALLAAKPRCASCAGLL